MARKHWTQYPWDETVYGKHKYGVGVYRFKRDTYEPVEYWLDREESTENEEKLYEGYLKENGWEE